ncbi:MULTISPECIES: hypothetical protein [Chitinophagaceae]|uniref:hypothetical protein n=1 Tax=Chitinophagaceae TaxID=563835 RepID=UPI000DEFAABD|nr:MULTISPECIES: hypothetical protein [Chitinophagaceae]RPD46029.1 hypothetical protein DRJ53_14745 [Paracnuella aquatica]
MKLPEYLRINEETQFDVLEHQGVLLAEREAAYCTLRLYALGDFYVELHHHQHFNVIVRLQAFATGSHQFDQWLDDIGIDELMA